MLGQGKQSRSVRPWRKFKAISGIITKDGFTLKYAVQNYVVNSECSQFYYLFAKNIARYRKAQKTTDFTSYSFVVLFIVYFLFFILKNC